MLKISMSLIPFNVMRCIMSEMQTLGLIRAQRNYRMTTSLKRWIKNGAPDKRDLQEDS